MTSTHFWDFFCPHCPRNICTVCPQNWVISPWLFPDPLLCGRHTCKPHARQRASERDTLIAVKIGLPLAKRNARPSSDLRERLRGFGRSEGDNRGITLFRERTLIISASSSCVPRARCIFAQRRGMAPSHSVER